MGKTSESVDGAIQELLKAPPQVRIDFSGTPRDKWLALLRGSVTASAVRRTNVIEVSYRSREPKAAEAVVQAVVQSYLAFMERNHKNVSAEIVQILEKERDEISRQLDQRQRDLISTDARDLQGDSSLRAQASYISDPSGPAPGVDCRAKHPRP